MMQKQNGMAMLIVLMFIALLTFIAAASLYLGYFQHSFARSNYDETRALYSAESGIEQARYWFGHPEAFRISGHFRNGYADLPELFFSKRLQDHTSFFDPGGNSQFQGTTASPDLFLSIPEDESLLNHPGNGLFKSIQEGGKTAALMITRPVTPGALCQVRSTGISGKMVRTVRVELSDDGTSIVPGTWWEE
ncbi:MAG: hypothetical protein HZA19_04105 [Nitrospirae bacterium]|nr:hypothetical protein [Nitrospirota bacterium]